MDIVLLGGTGFVGHHLLAALSDAGHSCRVPSRHLSRHRDLSLLPGVSLVAADIHDTEKLIELIEGAEVAINLVGILNERGRNGMGFWKVHVGVVENLITACRAAGVGRLVHISALNAGKGKSFYLRSKGRAEELIADSEGLDWTIIQPSVMFGAGDSFFNRFAGLLKLMPILPLACYRTRLQPVCVEDVTAAITAIVNRDPAIQDPVGQTLVVVGPQEYTLHELVCFTAQSLGLKRWVVGQPDFVSRLQGLLMDFVPGKPFSSDNYHALQLDSTSVENALWRLGIEPQQLESIVPTYLVESSRQQRLNRFRSR